MVLTLSLIELKEKILCLLREDEEFRLAVAGLIGLDAILSELKKLREDFHYFMKEQEKRWGTTISAGRRTIRGGKRTGVDGKRILRGGKRLTRDLR